jgi:putative addiction module CopG family antidote
MSATLTAPLTPEIEEMIRRTVESGRFADEREVVLEALRVFDEQERLQRLGEALAIGLEQIERGEEAEYTLELLEQIDQAASRQFKAGKVPKSDVVP